MTVAELRKLLNDTPSEYDSFVVKDMDDNPIDGWDVPPTEFNSSTIGDTYSNALYLVHFDEERVEWNNAGYLLPGHDY